MSWREGLQEEVEETVLWSSPLRRLTQAALLGSQEAKWKQSDKGGGSHPGLHGPQRDLGTVKTAEALFCWVVVNYLTQSDNLNQ